MADPRHPGSLELRRHGCRRYIAQLRCHILWVSHQCGLVGFLASLVCMGD